MWWRTQRKRSELSALFFGFRSLYFTVCFLCFEDLTEGKEMRTQYYAILLQLCLLTVTSVFLSGQSKPMLMHNSLLMSRRQNGAIHLATLKTWESVMVPALNEKQSKADAHALLESRRQRGAASVSALKAWENVAVAAESEQRERKGQKRSPSYWLMLRYWVADLLSL